MIAVLIISAVLLSFFCSLVLKKQHAAVLLIVMVSSQMSAQANNLILFILFSAMLQFLYAFLETKQNRSFLLISLLPITYILIIFLIQPYRINSYNYLGYLAALFIFAWIALIKWDAKKIVKFLMAYGLYFVSMGFAEKIFTNNLRVGEVITSATAYAVVLVIVWAIWIVNVYLSKIYSIKIIMLGTLFVFLAIIFSGTRMGLIGIFMGFGLCGLSVIFMKTKNINIIKIVAYSAGIIILLSFLSIITWNLLPNDLLIKKTFSTLIQGKLDDSNLGRVFLWYAAIDIFDNNKLLGIGTGNFPEKCKIFFDSKGISLRVGVGVNTHAHNIYLVMLSEYGIIGFLILIVFAFFCMLRLFLYFMQNRDSTIFYAFLVGFLIMATLGLVDATPMYMPTAGFAAWFFGVCASFRNERNICKSQ